MPDIELKEYIEVKVPKEIHEKLERVAKSIGYTVDEVIGVLLLEEINTFIVERMRKEMYG